MREVRNSYRIGTCFMHGEVRNAYRIGTYIMYEGGEKCIQNFLTGNLKGRENLEDLVIEGRRVLK
jgi:hypothetical protein